MYTNWNSKLFFFLFKYGCLKLPSFYPTYLSLHSPTFLEIFAEQTERRNVTSDGNVA